ncbi:MAG: VOC family protein [Acidimicrobiales bacterium]
MARVDHEERTMVNPLPDNYPRVNPYLAIDGAAAAIEFYVAVFGATERMRIADPSGKIGHTEIEIGDSVIMISDEYPEMNVLGPLTVGGTPTWLLVYVPDVDATFQKAIELGATEIRPVEDQFFGDRTGQFVDPWGHRWGVASHIEEVAPDEMERRAAEEMGGG